VILRQKLCSAKRVGYAQLFADANRRGILDFAMSGNSSCALSGRIVVDAMPATLAD